MAGLTFDQPLSAAAMTDMMEGIMTGQRSADETSTFLTTLAKRGETAEEIATAAHVLRAHAVKLPLSRSYELCDTCGTGGDGRGTINVSTLAALVAAAAGVRVAKHGNRAVSSQCGSADLLEALGINLQASPAQVARCIEEIGFGFCFAPVFHPAMKQVAPIRKALGIRTIFNLIGPLANPASLRFQVVGVSEMRLLDPIAEALVQLGVHHALVVHGYDGMDEVTTTGPTELREVRNGTVTHGEIDPQSLRIRAVRLEDLRGGDTTQNAAFARAVLSGTPSAMADLVAVNAGCALYVADQASTIQEGVVQAQAVLASGRAITMLEQIKVMTHAG